MPSWPYSPVHLSRPSQRQSTSWTLPVLRTTASCVNMNRSSLRAWSSRYTILHCHCHAVCVITVLSCICQAVVCHIVKLCVSSVCVAVSSCVCRTVLESAICFVIHGTPNVVMSLVQMLFCYRHNRFASCLH